MEFRWNDWNLDHATRHGVNPGEAEAVVRGATAPYPEHRGDDKYMVIGRGVGGRFVRVVFVEDEEGMVFVIHAMPLRERDKWRYRRRMR
jgi:uncharacterized DUF497 family protein